LLTTFFNKLNFDKTKLSKENFIDNQKFSVNMSN
jgi:hypothetical protein